jgi:hypothetical protein
MVHSKTLKKASKQFQRQKERDKGRIEQAKKSQTNTKRLKKKKFYRLYLV